MPALWRHEDQQKVFDQDANMERFYFSVSAVFPVGVQTQSLREPAFPWSRVKGK